jgi:hypothetical protein
MFSFVIALFQCSSSTPASSKRAIFRLSVKSIEPAAMSALNTGLESVLAIKGLDMLNPSRTGILQGIAGNIE